LQANDNKTLTKNCLKQKELVGRKPNKWKQKTNENSKTEVLVNQTQQLHGQRFFYFLFIFVNKGESY